MRAKHLYIGRSKTEWQTDEFLWVKTCAVVFGDLSGFRHLADCFRQAILDRETVPIISWKQPAPLMQGVIVAPVVTRTRKRLLRFVERAVVVATAPVIEMVIYGNVAGYRWLMEEVERTSQMPVPFLDHAHVDEPLCSFLIQPSIDMMLRAPCKSWDREQSEEQDHYREGAIKGWPLEALPVRIQGMSAELFPYMLPSDQDSIAKEMRDHSPSADK